MRPGFDITFQLHSILKRCNEKKLFVIYSQGDETDVVRLTSASGTVFIRISMVQSSLNFVWLKLDCILNSAICQ